MENKGWIDITVALEHGMVYWPGDLPVEISKTADMKSDKVNVTGLHLSAHTATHVDSPLHFIKNGGDVAGLPLEKLIGTARVIHISDMHSIALQAIKAIPFQKGETVLFKTRHSESPWSHLPFQNDYVFLSKDAANFLIEKEINGVGIDYLSIAEFGNGAEVHEILLSNNLLIIEGLNLADVEPGLYNLICLPLKIKGGDGAPARVIIRKK